MRRRVVIHITLIIATFAAFWEVSRCDFINLDDGGYVTQNHLVQAGMTWAGIAWAFTSGHMSNWHPLTWISHMADCQLFGLQPGGHHLVNVFIHTCNALLLFEVLRRMTGKLWQSAFVAALFAWHPVHVESVAWVSERKDVLSGFFWLLTMLAYSHYAKQPSTTRYLVTFAAFVAGLLCKPMLVTLPFVLLLLDYWPLKRVSEIGLKDKQSQRPGRSWKQLISEKAPFFIVSALSSVITLWAQAAGGAIATFTQTPLDLRVANSVVSCLRYLGKLAWPSSLCVLYPIPSHWPPQTVALAGGLLLLVSALALLARKRIPFLPVGWFWFLGTLVPVIGLVQVGSQAMADRYLYLPAIGVFMLVAWGVAELAARWRLPQWIPAVAASTVLLGCLICTRLQVGYWKDGIRLFEHTVAVTDNNLLAQVYYGDALLASGERPRALQYFNAVSAIDPTVGNVCGRVGKLLEEQGKLEEAIEAYRRALKVQPDSIEALNNLAWILATSENDRFRDGPEAVRLAQHACELTHYRRAVLIGTLAAAYAEAGRFSEAVSAGEKAAEIAQAGLDLQLAEANRKLTGIYRSNQPYRDRPPAR